MKKIIFYILSCTILTLSNNVYSQLVVKSNGNVGVGESNPTSKLDIIGSTSIQGTLYTSNDASFWGNIGIGINASPYHKLQVEGKTCLKQNVGIGTLSNTTDKLYVLGRVNMNGVIVDSLGKVGIGISNPTEKLHVSGTVKINNGVSIDMDGNMRISPSLPWIGAPVYKLEVNGGNTSMNGLYTLTNGNVGIGTSNPTHKLEVNGGAHFISSTCDYCKTLYVSIDNNKSYAYNLVNKARSKEVFFVSGEGYLWTEKGGYWGSDKKMKQNIRKIETPLQNILKLNGVTYQYKDDALLIEKEEKDLKSSNNVKDKKKGYRFGFVAQEVEEVFPEVVKTMPDSTKAIAYTDLIAIVVEALKEQQLQISTLQDVITTQEKEIISLKNNCLGKQKETKETKEASSLNQTNISDEVQLYQNTPNPFSSQTQIRYTLPKNTFSAKINVYDLQGQEVMSFVVDPQQREGSVIIKVNELTAGMYLYSLLVDNQLIDTKKMVLTKQ